MANRRTLAVWLVWLVLATPAGAQLKIATGSASAAADAVVDRIDAGSGPGTLVIFGAACPDAANDADAGSTLAVLTFSDPAFGSATNGVATANAITADSSADNTGTAMCFRAKDSTGAVVFQGTITTAGNGGDLILSSTSVKTGQSVAITALTYTQPTETTLVAEAASCSRADVAAAITAAADGYFVLIPDGSCTWTSGITTTKQVLIRAEHYTPTTGGDTTRSVLITNNATEPLLTMTTGDDYHIGVVGIHFVEGSGTSSHLRVEGTGTKVARVHDNLFEVTQRNGNTMDVSVLVWLAQGGVLWNNRFEGQYTGDPDKINPDGANILIHSPRAWATASTMGTLDTDGAVNVYFEDCTFFNVGFTPDLDDNGRVVFRHNGFDGATGGAHGFTSAYGGRHSEHYDNTFVISNMFVNVSGRYYWMRGGTGVFFNNYASADYTGYTAPIFLALVVEGGGTYPKPRQVGWGHNGTTNVSDPVYVWNQTGTAAYDVENDTPSLIEEDRDYFVNAGAKPGYTAYTYPHPVR